MLEISASKDQHKTTIKRAVEAIITMDIITVFF
jgi:hypothetical protein